MIWHNSKMTDAVWLNTAIDATDRNGVDDLIFKKHFFGEAVFLLRS
jgi:hypothetical protein